MLRLCLREKWFGSPTGRFGSMLQRHRTSSGCGPIKYGRCSHGYYKEAARRDCKTMGAVERLNRELRHLLEGPSADEKLMGLGSVRFIAQCDADSWQVLSKAKTVLTELDQVAIEDWPPDSTWCEVLPDWFVAQCAPEPTREESEALLKSWRVLTWEEQARFEREDIWPLSSWLYWLKPENRKWFWWDAAELDADKIVIAVEVDDWPFPWGSLAWLLRAAGATRVDAEE